LSVAAATYARIRWLIRPRTIDRTTAIAGLVVLFVACFGLYAAMGPNQSETDGWFPLASALLHGHLYIDGSRPWIELVPAGGGNYYLPFPPIPAVVLVPIVAVFGESFTDTSGVTALAGAANVLLVMAMLRQLKLRTSEVLVLTFAFAFGSEAFYVAATGGVHLWTETLAMTFVLCALNLGLRGSRPWLAGVLVGLAVGCRPTILMAAPAFIVLYWRFGGWLARPSVSGSTVSGSTDPGSADPGSADPASTNPAHSDLAIADRARSYPSPDAVAAGSRPVDLSPAAPAAAAVPSGPGLALRLGRFDVGDFLRRPDVLGLASLALGAALVGIWLAWFNVARFGSPTEFGYDLITGQNGQSVLSEPWYTQGIVSPFYLARGLFTMFLRGWDFNEAFPWVEPNWAGCAFYFTTPILIYLVRAVWREPLVLAGWLGFVLPVGLDLMHGNPGYAQFGYRFILDGMPFAWLLLGLVVARRGLSRGMVLAVAVGTAINVYGMICIAAGFVD
jgi:hypothetical protein